MEKSQIKEESQKTGYGSNQERDLTDLEYEITK